MRENENKAISEKTKESPMCVSISYTRTQSRLSPAVIALVIAPFISASRIIHKLRLQNPHNIHLNPQLSPLVSVDGLAARARTSGFSDSFHLR